MANIASFLHCICFLVGVTSVQPQLNFHQQHMKIHQELLNKQHQTEGLRANLPNAAHQRFPRPAVPPMEQHRTAGQHFAGGDPSGKPPVVNSPPKKEDSDQDKAAEALRAPTETAPEAPIVAAKNPIHVIKEAGKTDGGASNGPHAGGSEPQESNMARDTPPDPHKGGSSETPDLPKPKQNTQEKPHLDDSTRMDDPVSEDENTKTGEQPAVDDEEVIFIDGNEEETEKTYPDPDLDNEDAGIGELTGGAQEEKRMVDREEEEEEEEEDYDRDDYFDDVHRVNGQQPRPAPPEDGELIRSLAYKDLEDTLADQRYVMMHFVSEGCSRCEIFRPHFVAVAKNFWQLELADSGEEQPTIYFYEVTDQQLLVRFNLRVLPTVFFFRNGVPILYEGDLNADDLQQWTFAHLDVMGWALTEENFDEETKATKDKDSSIQWLVHFCDVDAVGCDGFMATWESAASRMKQEVMFGYVDVGVEVTLAKRFNVDLDNLPAIVLLKQGQAFWCTLPLLELTTDSLIRFVKEGHLITEKEQVPDKLSTLAALVVKAGANVKGIVLTVLATMIIMYITYFFICRRRKLQDAGKEKGV